MNFRNIFRRPKASIVPPLLVCGAIAAQHGFLQFYIVKVFLGDYNAPTIALIYGALWEICIRLAFTIAGIVVLVS